MSDRMRGPPKRSLPCQERQGQPDPDSQPPSESECDADLRNMHKTFVKEGFCVFDFAMTMNFALMSLFLN